MQAYVDNSATTRPSDVAIQAMADCMREGFYNPSSVYRPAVDAMRKVRDCREAILSSVFAKDADLIFTSGGTEANNLAIIGAVNKMRGKQVLAVSCVEHPSVLEAFRSLQAQGHDVRYIDVDECGLLNYETLAKALDDGASLVSCMHVNNETGALLNAEKLYRTVAGRAIVHVDGVQGYLRVPFDMKWADMYTVSAHKIHGPKGTGALVLKKGVRLEPRQIGGGQENGVRSGTENTPGIAGFGAAVREMVLLGEPARQQMMQHKLALIELCRNVVPELLVNGPAPENAAPHIVNLGFPGVRGEVMLHALEAERVYVSTGSACSSKKLKVSSVLTAMGIAPAKAEWAVRFSLSPYTTMEEIEYTAEMVGKCYNLLKRFQRR